VIFCVGCRKETRKDYARQLPEGQVALRKITDPLKIPDFSPAWDNRDGLLQSIDYSLDYLAHPSSKEFFPYLDVDHDRAQQSLTIIKDILLSSTSGKDMNTKIRAKFEVYESVGCDDQGTVLFTGYCQPIYEASLERTDVFRYPLYKLPNDLVKDEYGTPKGRKTADGNIVPYYSRKEIETQGLMDGTELIWLKDRFSAFVVHVQGSAKFRLPDGSFYDVGYAGKTDHEYVSVGQLLVKDGKIPADELSLRKIREYFEANPQDLDAYLWQNECYVFFRHVEGGPYGCLGVPVTPYRSLATDKDVYPRACLSFIQTKVPRYDGGTIVTSDFQSFLLDQDRGGAIRSAGRADIFMGTGDTAEELAGRTRQEGRVYYLFLKPEFVMPKVSMR